jgi:hypothetical protein
MGWRRQLVVSVVGGVAAMSLLAFGCAVWSPREPESAEHDAEVVLRHRYYPEISSFSSPSAMQETGFGRTDYISLALVDSTADRATTTIAVHRLTSGWPARAYVGEHHYGTWLGESVLEDAFLVPTWGGNYERLVGYRPIPVGWLIDAGVFSLATWMVVFGFVNVRGLARRRRGRCLRCGYPLGTASTCTECGATVRS